MRGTWRVIALLGVMASAASAQNPGGASPIEQALMEHACLSALPAIAGADAYQDCLSARLRALRADFGRDLSRVSVEDRTTLDAACSASRTAEGREAYLECLTVQLAAIRNRRSPGPAASDATAPPSENAQPASLTTSARQASSISPLWLGIGLVTLVAAIGGAWLAVKGRRATRTCRVCGDDVPEAGDLCPKCRHEAAEALRQAAAQRADQDRAQAEERTRARAREEERRLQQARDDEAARLRQEQEARHREESVRQLQKEEEESRRRSRNSGDDVEEVFDPYTVLGVARDADKEAIEAAYQAGQLKYAPEQVSHLGSELQEHYRRKTEAVARAYRMLTG